jgi:hypothetical protein
VLGDWMPGRDENRWVPVGTSVGARDYLSIPNGGLRISRATFEPGCLSLPSAFKGRAAVRYG